MIIDMHTHIFPTKIENVAVKAIGDFYDTEMAHGASVDELLTSAKRAGVDKCLVFSSATTAAQVESINSFIMRECGAHPEFYGAGTLHKDYENYEQELCRLYDAGIRGIKLHPDFQKFDVDDPKMFPMYEIMEAKGMFLIAHIGDPRYPYSHPKKMEFLAKRYPKMRFIAAHFGGWSMWDVARDCLVLPNVYVDTSSTLGFGGTEPFLLGLKTFDPGHIFFGSDFPMWDQAEELERVRSLDIDPELLDNILSGNFLRFMEELK